MKKIWLFVILSLTLIVTACGNSQEDAPVNDKDQGTPASVNKEEDQSKPKMDLEEAEVNETDEANEQAVEPTATDDVDATSGEVVSAGDNLLQEDWVAKYEDDDVVMTLNLAEFTDEFTTASGNDDRGKSGDSNTLFHIQGKINNDTTDRFEFAHPVAPLKFKLVYDNKHEFELTGAAETADGKSFDGASILPLLEQTFHLYANVPLPVAETDKSLVLIITNPEGEVEVSLR